MRCCRLKFSFDYEILKSIVLYYHTSIDIHPDGQSIIARFNEENPKKFMAHQRFLKYALCYDNDHFLTLRGMWLVHMVKANTSDHINHITRLAVNSGMFSK